jgi:non-specific serine/threonine protein kinase/serine/threonine-protein kinase
LANQTNLAATLIREGRYVEAEQIARDTIDIDRRVLGPIHNDTVETLRRLGMALANRDRYAEASALFRDLIDKQSHSAAQGDSWSAWYDFACVAAAANQSDDAFRYLREAINHGYKDARGLATDDDLRSLRSNPKFQQLLVELKSPPAEAGTQPRKSP